MGSASSTAVRRLPRVTGSESATARPRLEKSLAFESKNEAIEGDTKDPEFMEKLNQLGPVRVDHHTSTVQAASDAQSMYRSRMQSEAEASNLQSTKDRLLASSLTDLLDTRKSTTDRGELETLATRYQLDVAKLERLGRVVNTPSIDESTVAWMTDKDGEKSLAMMACWVDPVLPTLGSKS